MWLLKEPPTHDITAGESRMNAHCHTAHTGKTEISFTTSLGTAVEGLSYRLSDGQGNTQSAITGVGGKGITVHVGDGRVSSSTPDVWVLSGSVRVQIEVQRDDGSWKEIGSFQHEADLHKQVNVIAGAVAMPFQMDPV